MFEIGIFSVIILAAAYWLGLWLMGRREDVLHGQFVSGFLQPDEPPQTIFSDQQPFRPDLLESLLTSLKRDLDEVVRS